MSNINNLIKDFLANISSTEENLFPYLANSGEFTPGESPVYYSGPYWTNDEIEVILKSFLAGKWLASGEEVNKFEIKFSKKFNKKYSLMVNSGSSANLIMFAALKQWFGWQDGDEIIVSCVGFPTTIAPIVQCGLKPVFVDIDFSDLNWDVSEIEDKITTRTRGIISSPVLGNPYDYDQIVDICERNKIYLIADNCDSLGSKWDGNYLTDKAIAASCSFYPAHPICTGEGGKVSSDDEELITIARSLAWWGRDCYCVGAQNLLSCGVCGKRFDKWIEKYDGIIDHKYVYSQMGYNLKPMDFQGAVGSVQIEKFDEIHYLRRMNKTLIQKHFEKIPGVRSVNELPKAEASWFGVPIICDSKETKNKLTQHLESNKVQTRNYFAGNILMHPGYSHLDYYKNYPNACKVLDLVFFVGCSPTITEDMIDYIGTVTSSFKK
jgi:CDP-6-deoxy-D-xylo-4-hexulose-3-dehydrase